MYQENHEIVRDDNEVIAQVSNYNGACYGVSKCAEIVLERRKMLRGERLEFLEERTKTIDPREVGTYKFLGMEQADGIKTKKVSEWVNGELNKRVKMLTKTDLNDVNLVRAINTKVIPVAA